MARKPPAPLPYTIGDVVLVRALAVREDAAQWVLDHRAEFGPHPDRSQSSERLWHWDHSDAAPSGLRVWCSEALGAPRHGVIVGRGARQDGVYHPGFGGSWSEDPEPPRWECRRVHHVWLVRFRLHGPEVPVFEAALTMARPGRWTLPR